MNCKKCGAPLMEHDQFCKSCGAAVNEINAQNNIGESQQSFTHNEFNSVQQPVNNVMSEQPINSIQQPVNNVMSEQPINSIQQPVNNVMSGQPINSIQQPINNYNNGYNVQPVYSQPTKKNNTKFIFIGIGVAILITIVVLIFVLGGNKNKEETNNVVNNESNSSVNNKSNSNYTVKFKGFTFKIPTNLVYETKTDSILLGDEDGTWATYIEVIEGSYNQMISQKSQLQSIYQSMGYTSSIAVEKTIGDMPFITLEVSMSGTNALLGLAKANSMNMFGITAYNIDNEYDYDLLKNVSSILSSAEYTGETNNMSIFEKIDMSVISGLAQ